MLSYGVMFCYVMFCCGIYRVVCVCALCYLLRYVMLCVLCALCCVCCLCCLLCLCLYVNQVIDNRVLLENTV